MNLQKKRAPGLDDHEWFDSEIWGLLHGPQRRLQRWVVLAVSTNMPAATRLATGADVSRIRPHLSESDH
ncbi:MAG: hypothetical protein AAF628_22170 [Planctomycetota bacterium]